MAKVKFRTAMSVLKKGGKACYQCVPVLENKVTEAGFLAEAAKITGESVARARLWLDAFGMVARKCNLDARPYSTGYMRGSLAIIGSVDAANAKLDPKVNRIVPTLTPLGTLKDVPSPFDAENVTASVGAILYSVQQVGQASPNVIVKGGEVVVINGNFILTADGADTGVWLEKDGVIIARGVIGQSDHNTIDCTFPDGDFPEDGQYKLVIATRDGKNESFGVDRLERNVTVVNG